MLFALKVVLDYGFPEPKEQVHIRFWRQDFEGFYRDVKCTLIDIV